MASDFDPYHRWLAIPREEQPPDHYRLLGVARFESDAEVISNASDQRMTHLRTFANGKHSADSQRLLSEIATATRCLLDAAKKAQYDEQLRAKIAPAAQPQATKPLRVAQALPLPATPPVQTTPLPAPARPLPVQPIPAQVASPIIATPAEAGPGAAGRRTPRASSNTPLILAAVAAVVVLLIGGGAFVAYRMSQREVVENPDPKPNPKPKPKPPKPDDGPKPTPEPKPENDTRTAWFYGVAPDGKSRGVIQQTGNGQWNQSETSGQGYTFTEVSRTPEYVELRENRLNVVNRLYADRLEFKRGDRWLTAQQGRWVHSAEVAGLMRSGDPSIATNNNTPASSEERVAWYYARSPEGHQGVIHRVGEGKWEEKSSGGRSARFEEKEASDKGYITLFDSSRNLTVRLRPDQLVYSRDGGQKWFSAQRGHWIAAAEVPALLASLTSAKQDERTAWFYPNYNGKRGFFRLMAGKSWEEYEENKLKFRYEETERTDDYIELQREDGFRVRLYADHNESSIGKRGVDGEWVTAAELAARTKPKKPGFDYETAAVFYFPDFQGQSGYFLRTSNGWQEYLGGKLKQEWREAGHSNSSVMLDAGIGKRMVLTADFASAPNEPRRNGSWITREELQAITGKGSPTTPASKGPSYVFAGLGKVEVKGPRAALDTGKPFTLECWYRRSGELKSFAGLVQLGDLNLVVGEGTDRNGQPCCDYQLFSSSSGLSRTDEDGKLPNDQWHHLAITGDAGKVHVFHDGKPHHQVLFGDLGVRTLTPIVFGTARSNDGPESLTGEIKSIRISDRVTRPAGQTFEPPPPQDNDLGPAAEVVLTNVKVEKLGDTPPRTSLEDLVKKPESKPEPVDRVKPPDAESLKAAQAKVNEVYGDKVKLATKPAEKQTLAAELLKIASSDQDPVQAYALLIESRRLAVAAGDVILAIDIINEVDRRYDVDRLTLLEKLLSDTEKRNLIPEQFLRLVDEALAGVHEALRAEKIPQADALSVIASRSASKSKEPERKKAAQALRDHVVAVKNSYEAMQAGREKLKEAPDDPVANLAVGRYIALASGDFAKGSEHLAKGSDAALAAAARKELGANNDDDRLAAAEAWHGLLASLKSPAEKTQIQRHVLKVCQDLSTRLSGLAKAQAEKHVEELRPIIAEADKFDVTNRGSSKPVPGLIVRVFANRSGTQVATPYLAVVAGDQDMFRLGTSNLVRAYGLGTTARFAMSGTIVVENDMEVDMRFSGCTVTIAGRTNTNSLFELVPMKKGVYPITILSTSSSPTFGVSRRDTGESLFFHIERDLEAELAKTAPDPTGAPVKSQKIN